MISLFGVTLGWTPISGSETWRHFILPMATLGVGAMDGSRRLQRAFDPVAELLKPEPVLVEAWITPPAYTNLPPIVLAAGDKKEGREGSAVRPVSEPIAVPEGSSLLVQVDGGKTAPTLYVRFGGRIRTAVMRLR